ncbi:N-acetyltransferase [Apibacter sp. HY039]|uniref:GNAT family N-acetyltransferase n=1 Tax=Apibacter sp. HY039 TaxID=2501476 RepID=UPI000FEBA41D|nr:GNAT family N-acetyltransferase [Apibacter sp. HY039]
MIEVTQKEKNVVLEILHSAFYDVLIPNSINFTIKKDTKRYERLMALMDYQFKMAMKYGEIYLSDDKNGCVLYINKIYPSIQKVYWETELLLKCIGVQNIFKILKREKLLKASHPKEPFKHLWLMGIRKEYQGKGIGNKLLKETLNRYQGDVIYVETTTPQNIKFYTRLGFTIFHETNELNYPLFFLKLRNV